MIYEFGPFRLDTEKHRLVREGRVISLPPKAIDTLRVLVEHRNELVVRDELMKAIWPDVAVEDGNLSVAVSTLRKALGEDKGEKFIETIPRQGYKFLAEVREIEPERAVVVEKYAKSQVTINERIDIDAPKALRLFWPRSRTAKVATVSVMALLAVGLFGYVAKSRSSAGGADKIQTLAVLPFQSINGAADNSHQGLAMSDILITRLSNLRAVTVRPTAAVMSYENTTDDLATIAARLKVDAVLQGTIYRVDDRIRVTAQLIKASDETPLWAGQFEKPIRDQLRLQDEIALQIVDALALNLTGTEHGALTKRYTNSNEAYQLYLQGRRHWNKRNYEGIAEAQRLFRQAVDTDPKFALAYVGLADTLLFANPTPEPGSYIAKALEIDPALSEAYASQGFLLAIHQWKWREAEQSLKKSIELNPNYATAHHWYAILLGIEGRYAEAKNEMQRAIDIDPTSYNFVADMGQLHYFTQEYDKAREYCNKALSIFPDFNYAHHYLAEINLQQGDYEGYVSEGVLAAFTMNSTATQKAPSDDVRKQTIDRELENYRQIGINRYFEQRLAQERTDTAAMKNTSFYYGEARSYAFLGQPEKALDGLERAYEARAFIMPWVKSEPLFDKLRGEPRFKAILQKMNL